MDKNKNEVDTNQSTPRSTNSVEETAVSSNISNYTPDETNNQVIENLKPATPKQYTEEDIDKLLKIKSLIDSKSKPNFYDGKTMKYREVADYLIKKFHIIKLHDELHIYTNGIYVSNMNILECLIRYVVPKVKPVEVKLVINELFFRAPEKIESNYKYVAMANKIIDISTMKEYEFDANMFVIASRINALYKKDILKTDTSNVEFVNSYFKNLSCGDKELATLYLEILGYCMVRSHKFQLAFLLKGSSNNGKSIYLKVLEGLTGRYCGHLNLQQLSNIKLLRGLCNCTTNIIDDTRQPKKIDLEQIQSIISGATIAVPQKDAEDFRFAPYSTLLLATTNILNFKDFNKSLTRRFKVVPFNADFENNRNDDIEEPICRPSNLNVIAYMALSAFSKVIEDGHFHIPESVESDTKAYFYENNQVLEFKELFPIKRLILKGSYFARYEKWCIDTGKEQAESNISTFGKKVLGLGYKPIDPSFDGSRLDYYAAPDFNVAKFREEYEAYHNSANADKDMKISAYISYLNRKDGIEI